MDVWAKTKHLFDTDDGSLPNIEFDVRENSTQSRVYSFLTNCAGILESETAYYWSKSKQSEIPISFGDNPADLVPANEAEPFHVVFGEITSPLGNNVPSLGLFVFQEMISLDYRMGQGWDENAVIGLFEILRTISKIVGSNFNHLGNQNDGGTELNEAFKMWLELSAT